MEPWRETVREVTRATVPIVGLLILFKLTLLDFDFESVAVVVLGSAMALVGLILFLFGAPVGILPFGERLGSTLPTYGIP